MNTSEVSNIAAQVETMTVVEKEGSIESVEEKSSAAHHVNFASRYPAGIAQPITIGKNGVRHVSFGRLYMNVL